MLFPILIALAICLCLAPLVSRVVASRIGAKQMLYARDNRDAIEAAAALWHQAVCEAVPVDSASGCGVTEHTPDGTPDQSEAIVEVS